MERQMQYQRYISRFLENFRKVGRNNYNPAMVRARIQSLKDAWFQFSEGHWMLEKTISETAKATTSYFSDHVFDETEDIYHSTLDRLAEVLEELEPPSSPRRMADLSSSRSSQHSLTLSHLPSIHVPPFDGSVAEWETFRDRFSSVIIENTELNDFVRMHFLISFLRGSALECISGLALTADNFAVAWQSLRDQYDGTRRLLGVHLTTLLSLPRMSRESLRELQSLRGQAKMTIASLRNLQRNPADLLNDFFIHIISQSLDPVTQKAWTLRLPENNEPLAYETFDNFLAGRIRALEAVSLRKVDKPTSKSYCSSRVHIATATSSTSSSCPICKAQHFFSSCSTFLRGNIGQRRELAKRHRRCFNCLSANHSAHECKSKYSCRTCHKRHHSLLHDASDFDRIVRKDVNQPNSASRVEEVEPEVHSLLAAVGAKRRAPVLLATARVNVQSNSGRVAAVRALLDQGSEITLISERIAQVLLAKRLRAPVSISAVGCVNVGRVRHAIELSVTPLDSSSPSFATTAIVLKSLTSYAPKQQVDLSSLKHLSGLAWADPNPLNSDTIDLIIGADLYSELLCDGVRKGARGDPIAQKTVFGWIISGPVPDPGLSGSSSSFPDSDEFPVDRVSSFHCLASLDDELKRFWEIEEIPVNSPLSPDDLRCEEHFEATHSRLPDGRYRVRLPLKEETPMPIGTSRFRAERTLAALLRRLNKIPTQRRAYFDFMREYESLGHMRQAPYPTDSIESIVYIPHHPVFRAHSMTSSLRVVFNASSLTSNGSSLNDHLLAGPKLQTDLPTIIMRWRNYPFVYCADIAKMFRKIRVDDRDINLQRILWSESHVEEPREFQLMTVTYGMVCAPYLALRVLQQLRVDEGLNFPVAAEILKNNIYVDDVLFGGDTVDEVSQARDQLVSLLGKGGFVLRKWSGNSPALLVDISEENCGLACSKTLASNEGVKVLGITWMPSEDAFSISVTLPEMIPRSKRSILSTIAKLYDPLGWVTPVTIVAKIFIQSLWRRNLSWDEEISDDLLLLWQRSYAALSSLNGLRISRWSGYCRDSKQIELHGFADASNKAYAAVVYCKITSKSNHETITLLAGKSKVAPLKVLSIPRLELLAAATLARLIEFVRSSHPFGNVSCYCWSDSIVVLTWLAQHPSKWKVFVANRVADIQTRVPGALWRYVPTSENPADCASRGLLGHELKHHTLWWQGPPWLTRSIDHWPQPLVPRLDDSSVEEKAVVLHSGQQIPPWDLLTRFSSWPKLIRVVAYVMRFTAACRHDKSGSASDSFTRGRALSAADCAAARIFVIKQLQSILFHDEIHCLATTRSLPAKSSILSLAPFLDNDGVLRVGGRISRSPLSFARRHPILLSSHRLTDQIIDHAHHSSLHAGIQLTLSVLRRDFWIIRARSLIRLRIHKCVVCVRERALTPTQLMSDLPRDRVSAPPRSFLHCGLDYAGPMQIRASAGRGITSRKAYIALFICLATRAIHLELVVDYTSQAFLNAFSRFSARRGLPQKIYSDNGTTFVGAEKELSAAYRSALLDPEFLNHTAMDGIEWQFIPPSAPHFGGLWEAGVKSVKSHLRRVLKTHTLTFEEMTTLLCRIEACLNSRPIAPLSDSLDDYEPLTPGHFLIGSPLTINPEPSLLNIKEDRLTRWQLVRHINEKFWKLWYNDYVNSLQQRSKWRTIQPSLKIGQLVLLKNANLPPCKWELGRIIRCHPGADGLTRVVTVRTMRSEVTRPIVKLCVLPVDCNSSDVPTASSSLS